MRKTILSLTLMVLGMIQIPLQAENTMLHLSLQTRDPNTNQILIKEENVDASKIGVVIVDPWNYHWCMTAS